MVTYYLDETGHVFQFPVASLREWAPPVLELPVLSGVNAAELRPGAAVNSAKFMATLQLLSRFPHSSMAGFAELKSIDLSGAEVLLVTTEQGSRVTFALDRIDEQLRRWRLVHELGRNHGLSILTLDLSVANNSPVRWRQTTIPAPAQTKNSQPSAHAKNHV